VETKRCTKCGEEKPLHSFYLNRARGADARQSRCKSCVTDHTSDWAIRNREKKTARVHGLSLQDVAAMLLGQEGRCAICTILFSKAPHIDHDHDNGRLRDLLCQRCNVALGHIERPGFLPRALDYLRRHGSADPLAGEDALGAVGVLSDDEVPVA
jgi:hypothetical protein